MKRLFTPLFVSAALAVSTMLPGLPMQATAQDELDIEALRRELQANREENAPAVAKPKNPSEALSDELFADSSPDTETVEQGLAQEAPSKTTLQVVEKSKAEVPVSEDAVGFKNENAAYLNDENRSLKKQVSELKKKLETKSEELEKVRSRLVIAETQVERLSSVIEQRNAQHLQAINPSNARASLPASAPQQRPQQVAPQPNPAANQQRPQAEMLVATVVANKANLRTGPGLENSPLMTVNKGTRLAVETRQGSWYRVIAPNGSRAWITGDVLNFESQGNVRVGGYVAPKKQSF